MSVLVTGGLGYIGSHACVELLNKDHEVVVVDNLSNSSEKVAERIRKISGKSPVFYPVDIRDRKALGKIFRSHAIESVIHFAGFKAVGESAQKPLMYYDNNLNGVLGLCEVMGSSGSKTLVFSSSATVYGDPTTVPVREDAPLSPQSPYGRTKLMVEEILRDLHRGNREWRIALLRYFNPVGAHPSGEMGEDPRGIPNNLMPYISQVAVNRLEGLEVFGGDYPTPDGTGIRDYIHVMDLVRGHLQALERLERTTKDGFLIVNLGTGRGHSVLEVIRAFEKVSERKIPYEITDRRPGDVAEYYADPSLAAEILDWRAEYDIEKMCLDTWNWQRRHPDGYETQS